MALKPVFKSAEGREKILSRYRSLIARLPVPYKESMVATSFGETYLLEAGREEAPPVLMLHGSCSNSAMWIGDIPALSERHRVLCADIVGEAGNSAPNRLRLATDDYARWTGEVLDALEIRRSALVGNSLGGWIALQTASLFPERITHLVLIAPSGLVPIRPGYLFRLLYHGMRGEKGMESLARLMYGGDAVPAEVIEVSRLIMDNYNPIMCALRVLTDSELGRLAMPVLYIAGANDVTADTKKAADRLRRLVPHAGIERIPDHGHVVYDTMDRVMPFLSQQRP
jgi:pimeloyl-ACP methyl ester carboxylesterase